jgi:hypothetical protein
MEGLNFIVDESLGCHGRRHGLGRLQISGQDEASRLVSLVKGAMISTKNAVVGSPPKASKQAARPTLY